MKTALIPDKGIVWIGRDRRFDPEQLGFLIGFLDAHDPRDAKTQLDAHYGYGGHWQSKPHEIDKEDRLHYPGDPPLPPLAETRLRDERILFYPYEFVAVVQADGSFAVQRMD